MSCQLCTITCFQSFCDSSWVAAMRQDSWSQGWSQRSQDWSQQWGQQSWGQDWDQSWANDDRGQQDQHQSWLDDRRMAEAAVRIDVAANGHATRVSVVQSLAALPPVNEHCARKSLFSRDRPRKVCHDLRGLHDLLFLLSKSQIRSGCPNIGPFKMLLFGSRAHGITCPFSDADTALLMRPGPGPSGEQALTAVCNWMQAESKKQPGGPFQFPPASGSPRASRSW